MEVEELAKTKGKLQREVEASKLLQASSSLLYSCTPAIMPSNSYQTTNAFASHFVPSLIAFFSEIKRKPLTLCVYRKN